MIVNLPREWKKSQMDSQRRIEVLEQKHKDLHKHIEVMEVENAPEHYITKLKKEKLAVKDEITRLSEWPGQDSGIDGML